MGNHQIAFPIVFGTCPRWRAAPIALCAVLFASACGNDASAQPSVVASFYPLTFVAERIAGNRLQVLDLTPAAAEPHDLEITSRQLDQLEDAEVVVYLGGDFQPAIERVAPRLERAIDVGEASRTRPGDPHVWLDPRAMADMAQRVAQAIMDADPGGRPGYERNLRRLTVDLEDLDADYEGGLADCERRLVVTSHEAFGYLTDRYGLEQEALAGFSPEAEPDPQRLAELSDLVRSRGVTTVFTERLVSPRVADALAREVGVDTAVLDPVESEPEQGDYLDAMRANLAELRAALACR